MAKKLKVTAGDRNPCPICGKMKVLDFEVCEYCGWENDIYVLAHPDTLRGANKMTVNEARKAYAEGKKIE